MMFLNGSVCIFNWQKRNVLEPEILEFLEI